jgi:ABC-type transport system substrate-binding protein
MEDQSMTIRAVSSAFLAAGLLVAAPAFAQTTTSPTKTAVEKQKTDGDSPTTVGPGSKAYKQRTDGNSPTVVGPGSQAFKQRTDGESPTMVGPGSGAYKR